MPTFAACSKKEAASTIFSDNAAAQVAEAAAACDAARIDGLLKGGANPNAIGERGTSLLQWAMLNQCKAGFESLLTAGADPSHTDETGDTVMLYAAKANDPEYLDILLAHKVDPNAPNTVTGKTPLMYALFGGRDEQFHKLLAGGADPNLADPFGDTPLHVAAAINDFGHALDLLKAGANPTARNKHGDTFQRVFYVTPTKVLAAETIRQREAVLSWLREHDVPIEGGQ